jgi:ATP-dependent DNA helicase DinG
MPLSSEQKQRIQQTYSSWLTSNAFKPRRSQREMIAIIARTLASIEADEEGVRNSSYHNHLALLEAGTGTGKTIAYAIPAIVMAQLLDKKLVISTATVTLQEQLMHSDLPNLLEHSGLEFDFALAKGRQRYVCLTKLALRVAGIQSSQAGASMFPDEEEKLDQAAKAQVQSVADALESQHWNGDRDTLVTEVSQPVWQLLGADRASCSGKNCAQYAQCALFKARDKVRTADVIIANHDLVLADVAAGGGNILPAPEEAIFVFDEAHHLPEKSRKHLSHTITLEAANAALKQSKKLLVRLRKVKSGTQNFGSLSKHIEQLDEAEQPLLDALNITLSALLDQSEQAGDTVVQRFNHGVVPDEIRKPFAELAECLALKSGCLQKVQDSLSLLLKDADQKSAATWNVLYAEFGALAAHVDNLKNLSQSYALPDAANQAPKARWINRAMGAGYGGNIVLNTAPLSSAEILTKILWQRCYAAILTSATLAPLGDFGHFISKIGAASATNAHKILAGLPFEAAQFHVPNMTNSPTNASLHTEEVIRLLPELIAPQGGTLVLFASRKQLEDVYAALKTDFGESLFVQGRNARHTLIQKHKARIDGGEQSVILGLASFAEGLDLPGDYCVQVIIAKLPFSVPDGPVDLAMKEWVEANGGNAFKDISLPDTSVRLMQACGRLLRKETDTGRISLLDSRIVSKYYGKQLLASLPPFTRVLPA